MAASGLAIALAEAAVDRVPTVYSQMKAVIVLAVCLLASCAGFQSRYPSSLVGEWRYADRIQSCHYVFDQNGTFSGDVIYHGKTISKFTGRWSIEGNTLLYTYVRDALGRIPAGAVDRDKLLSVEEEFFVIEAADGHQRKYLRVRKQERVTVTRRGTGPGWRPSTVFVGIFARASPRFLEFSR